MAKELSDWLDDLIIVGVRLRVAVGLALLAGLVAVGLAVLFRLPPMVVGLVGIGAFGFALIAILTVERPWQPDRETTLDPE